MGRPTAPPLPRRETPGFPGFMKAVRTERVDADRIQGTGESGRARPATPPGGS